MTPAAHGSRSEPLRTRTARASSLPCRFVPDDLRRVLTRRWSGYRNDGKPGWGCILDVAGAALGRAGARDGGRCTPARASAMSAFFWIALGSALGGVGRYWCSGWVARRYGERFPWGTLVVNIVGSFVIGVFGGLSPEGNGSVDLGVRQFVMVGLCGGYTTFSSFSLQTLTLARDGQRREMWRNIVLSTLACLLAVWAGFAGALAFGPMEGP